MHLAWADSCRLTGQGGWPTHTMILGAPLMRSRIVHGWGLLASLVVR
jgi:hypothetical protein